jgi:hypothetical protein
MSGPETGSATQLHIIYCGALPWMNKRVPSAKDLTNALSSKGIKESESGIEPTSSGIVKSRLPRGLPRAIDLAIGKRLEVVELRSVWPSCPCAPDL